MSLVDEPDTAERSRNPAPLRRRARAGQVPIALLLLAALGMAFLVLPLIGLVVGAPWTTLPSRLAEPAVLTALRLSLLCATLATLLCLALGVPLAWLLARVDFPGRRIVRALVTVPLVLPPVVGGVALLLVFGRRGLVGSWLDSTFGITLPFTTAGVVLAEAFVAMPFLVIAVEGALRGADTRYEEAAATLGAGRWTTFTRVTLPLVAPGIAAGGGCAGPAHWASSEPPSPSLVTILAVRRPCPSRSTSHWRPTCRPRSCSASSCSSCPWRSSPACATAGSPAHERRRGHHDARRPPGYRTRHLPARPHAPHRGG
ncbi:ABC transporter permease [Actinopolymorpha pittospori]|uniref:ABC-type sulfate transport system permease component n=1 Tax=Actinopolymorpha pittospori TaxID=648752 RepID=A0A927N6C8_9ACTN|nr:ABC-type sulfate transport system permease component [Actinopolymorpha pittospori]